MSAVASPVSVPSDVTAHLASRLAGRLIPPTILFLCLLLILFAQDSSLLNDPDTQWHIAIGRWIWTQRSVPTTDLFSHTFAGAPWIAKEWVSQLILDAAFQGGGWRGVAAVAAIAVAASFTALYAWLRPRVRSTVALALTLVAVALASPHFLARPHILVLPIIVAWMAVLLSSLDRGRAPPLALAVLMAAWVNMHGSFPLGLVMAAVLALEGVFDAPPPLRLVRARQWGLFLAASAAAMMLSPYGWQAVLVPLQMSGNAATLRYIVEWQPLAIDLHGYITRALLVLLGVLMIRQPRANAFRIVAVAMLAYLMIRHTRFVSLFAVIGPMMAARAIGTWRGLGPEPTAEGSRILTVFAALLLVGVAVTAASSTPEPEAKMTPESAYRAAQAAGVSGPVYNDYDFGGYLIAHGVKTFVDGRTDQLFLGSFLPDLMAAIADKSDAPFAALLARHGVTWALVRTQSREAKHLTAMPGWRKIHEDPIAAVFVAASPR